MATYETNIPYSATWRNGTLASGNGGQVMKFTDSKAGDVLKVGDAVTVTTVLGDQNGFFRGTITVDGVVYPVVQYTFGSFSLHWAVGLPHSTPGLSREISSILDTSASFTVCFFPGTFIATPSGERMVEELVSGDLVLVGESRVAPVKWTGRQTVSTLFGPAERLMPVRFAAGSLGGGGNPLCRIAI